MVDRRVEVPGHNQRPGLRAQPLCDPEELFVPQGRLPAAVLSVDLLGGCPDYDAIEPACAEFDIPLIEDAAEALGATHRGRPAGSFGTCAAFSFNGNKIITTGGGGMINTDNEEWARRAKYLTTQAKDDPVEFVHGAVGYNYRLTDIACALGLSQLKKLSTNLARRREIALRRPASPRAA